MKTLLTIYILFSSILVYAQEPCWTQPVPPDDIPRKIMREAQEDEQWMIGVVVTVIGDLADHDLVNDAFIAEEMRLMNDAYGGRLPVTPPFVALDTRIQFRLHKTRRFYNNGNDFTSADHLAMYYPERGGATIDSPLYYVNLYYCNIDFAGGFSIFPRPNTIGSAVDGNVIRIQSVLNHRLVNPHEVGHWFNLYHTFQPPQAGCGTHTTGAGDEIDDTPPIFGSTAGCPHGRLACFLIPGNPVNAQGQPVANVANIMDYASCEENFTQGQKDRMRAAILFYRPQLLGTTPPPPIKYNCTNFTCAQSTTGAYSTLEACQAACVTPNQPPTCSIIPTKDTTVTVGTIVKITLIVTDDKRVERVELYLNGSRFVLSPPYSITFTAQVASSLTVYGKAYDAEGLSATSNTVKITIGQAPPPSEIRVKESFILPDNKIKFIGENGQIVIK